MVPSPRAEPPASVDPAYLQDHYRTLRDEELMRLAQGDLVADARALLSAELDARGLVVEQRDVHSRKLETSPYRPPRANVSDPPNVPAEVTVRGLVRIFQRLVIASGTLTVMLFVAPFVRYEQLAERTLAVLSGAAGLAAAIGSVLYHVESALLLVAAIGLFFFRWWSRYLLAGSYLLSIVTTTMAGRSTGYPLEGVLSTIASLIDGAILTLAFLPPLAKYFRRESM
jgi:hypothetical protein